MAHWSQALEQGESEPLADYVKRLEAERDGEVLTPVMKATERNRLLRDAKKRLRDMKAQLKKTPTTQEADNAGRRSPALREVMRLFRQLAGADRERFFVWYTGGMKGK